MIDREITSYVKGLAIISVLISHYAIFYFGSTLSYAYSFVSVFFVLSGMGIYLSLERQSAGQNPGGYLRGYLYKRVARIFPLFWLAYGLFVVQLALLDGLIGFDFSAFAAALAGFPTNPKGVFWFVSAILQCYLLAPLFFLLIRKSGLMVPLGAAVAMMGLFLPLSSWLGLSLVKQETIDLVNYKNLFLGNVLLFFLGMLIPPIIEKSGGFFRSYPVWIGSTLIFAGFIFATDSIHGERVFLVPLFLLSAFLFCLAIVSLKPRLPLPRLMSLAGDHSYPIYLFHHSFFILLFSLGVIRERSLVSIGYTLALLPLFFLLCYLLQSFSRKLSRIYIPVN